MALQSSSAVHLGVDNLGVVRHVGHLLDGHHGSVSLELVKDGDLLLLIERMLRLGGLDTVRITKVKGHADQEMVLDGRVRELDRLGNDAADEAADFGRRRVGNAVIDARRNLSRVCARWYPVMLDLHRFFIAVSRAVVNQDDGSGTAPDPLVWSAGAQPKRRRLVLDGRVREVDRLGNNAADEAADFGRRRVGTAVIDARRNLSAVCGRWYPVILDLHRFFIAISRAVVNQDGGDGTAPDPLVWSAGAHPKRRRLVHAVRDRAILPGPPAIWESEWVTFFRYPALDCWWFGSWGWWHFLCGASYSL